MRSTTITYLRNCVTTITYHTLHQLTSNSVYFIEEDDASFLRPCHLKEFPHHPSSLTNVLLHQFGTYHSNEAGVCAIGHGSSEQGLPRARWTKEKNSLWRINSKLYKSLRL